MARLALLVLAVLAAPFALAQSPVGDWAGGIEIGQPEPLRMVLHVGEAGDSLAVTLDVPQQGGVGIPATGVRATADSLVVDFAMFGGRFDLAVAADSLHGTFSQGPATLPITMTAAEPLRRPQEPQPPFPYGTEAVMVESEGGVELAGTFVTPEGTGPFPAVVFLTGSGAQDRDETIAGHRPFAVLADALARAGVASLRADDRGVGGSTGDYAAATLDTHLADARALIDALRARGDVSEVGVIGHSEGGLTALRVAGAVDFAVTLAGPAVRFAEIYPVQMESATRFAGVDSSAAALYRDAIAATLAPLVAAPEAPADSLRPVLDAAFSAGVSEIPTAQRMRMGLSGPSYNEVKGQILSAFLSPGFRSLMVYDPTPNVAALDVPLLALYGGRDFQVPADLNADVLREAAGEGRPVTVVVVERANHLFQTAETGALAEYGQIEETIAPETIAVIVDWITETASGTE